MFEICIFFKHFSHFQKKNILSTKSFQLFHTHLLKNHTFIRSTISCIEEFKNESFFIFSSMFEQAVITVV